MAANKRMATNGPLHPNVWLNLTLYGLNLIFHLTWKKFSKFSLKNKNQ